VQHGARPRAFEGDLPSNGFGQTLLAGHFNTIEVADQVNAMIERFLAVGLRGSRA
jgi:hypothetical protein